MICFRFVIVNTLHKGENRDNNNNNNNNNIVLLLGVDSNRKETQAFRRMMLCRVLNGYRRFGAVYCLHLQGTISVGVYKGKHFRQ